jgi:hypothetical protein
MSNKDQALFNLIKLAFFEGGVAATENKNPKEAFKEFINEIFKDDFIL